MSWNGFGDLDLTKVEADEGSRRLGTGTYTVKCTTAKVESIGDTNNKRVVADFVDVDGAGDIRMNFNVHHNNAQAAEIGLRQLKSFLVAAEHPSPDKPGDIGSLVGLKCQVYVGMGKPWRDNNGNERQQTEIKRFMGVEETAAPKKANDLNDDIPF